MKKIIKAIKYKLETIKYKFEWLKIYCSPFKPPIPKLYIGKIAIGVPYFFPRRWVKDKEKKGYMKAVSKKIGFDFIGLGWKTKYDSLIFEYHPIWSFVFFKWQITISFIAPEEDHLWECWLNYNYRTDKSKNKIEKIKQASDLYPCIWTIYNKNKKEEICYWNYILKNKYSKLFPLKYKRKLLIEKIINE